MKILLVINKTLKRNNIIKFDSGYFNFYVPLCELQHDVYLYDTVNPQEKNFAKVVESFQPDLIFTCLTGNSDITPYEPIDEIKNITEKGQIKTFNWFCDDTWRFHTFSKYICKQFTACSTPEYSYLNEYKKIGYSNIILGQWHSNENFYIQNEKKFNVGFSGGLTNVRNNFLQKLNKSISYISGCSYEDMMSFYSSCKIGLNLTVNDNDVDKKRQMKLRIFEITNANALLMTENVQNIEMYFEPNKEIICFENEIDCREKIEYFLQNDYAISEIAQKARNRFLKEHTSKIRLKSIIDQINKI